MCFAIDRVLRFKKVQSKKSNIFTDEVVNKFYDVIKTREFSRGYTMHILDEIDIMTKTFSQKFENLQVFSVDSTKMDVTVKSMFSNIK